MQNTKQSPVLILVQMHAEARCKSRMPVHLKEQGRVFQLVSASASVWAAQLGVRGGKRGSKNIRDNNYASSRPAPQTNASIVATPSTEIRLVI